MAAFEAGCSGEEVNRETHQHNRGGTVATRKTKVKSSTERILAIDVGGTGLKAAIIDADGQMKTERLRVATPHPCTPDQLVDALAKLVEPLVKEAPPTLMSIGFPGVVRNNRILTAPHFGVEGWHDIPLADSLAQRLGGLPVRMINDAEMQASPRSKDTDSSSC